MCRLFGQISASPTSAGDLLVDSERSLLRQADFDPGNPQRDGWGVAWFEGGTPRILKSAAPVFDEPRRFAEAASRARSTAVIGHLRAASNPRGIQARRLIRLDNTQPFTDGRLVFAHNGTLNIPDAVEARLGAYRRRVRGLNDSEVYFWQFVKHLDGLGSVAEALAACVEETWDIWRRLPPRGAARRPYTGLNTLVSDGRSLTALCHYYTAPGCSSIFSPSQPWGFMSMARRRAATGNGSAPDRVVISSEDLDAGRWERLGADGPEIVAAELRGSRLSVRRRPLRELADLPAAAR